MMSGVITSHHASLGGHGFYNSANYSSVINYKTFYYLHFLSPGILRRVRRKSCAREQSYTPGPPVVCYER